MPISKQSFHVCESGSDCHTVRESSIIADNGSGYELPRLNERLVYLVFFSISTSVAYAVLQKTVHRTMLRLKYVSVGILLCHGKLIFTDAPTDGTHGINKITARCHSRLCFFICCVLSTDLCHNPTHLMDVHSKACPNVHKVKGPVGD